MRRAFAARTLLARSFMASPSAGPVQESMQSKLTSALQPTFLEVINESYMHNVPKGSESHFKVIVVSDSFDGQKLIERHRSVNTILDAELKGEAVKGTAPVHALSIVAKTPAQWEKSDGAVSKSPACRGGSSM